MSIYDVDNKLVADRISPPLKRQPIYLAWLFALLSQVQYNRDLFLGTFRTATLTKLQYNSQKLILEYTLNNLFNFSGNTNSIYILQAEARIFTFHSVENAVVHYAYRASEAVDPALRLYSFHATESVHNDFTVNIPTNIPSIASKEPQVRALIDSLVFVGKHYSIIYYS